jgi:hypothetical protein
MLGNKWPVWVVAHDDGQVSVISAVAHPVQQQTGRDDWAGAAGLVSWIELQRRFGALGIFYDERGAALGYQSFDLCGSDCPQLEDLPHEVPALDTFEVRVDAAQGTVIVGAIRPPSKRAVANGWLDWRAGPIGKGLPVHQLPVLAGLAEAAAIPIGSHALVKGRLVRSTVAEPALCGEGREAGCGGFCAAVALPISGIPARRAGSTSLFERSPAFIRADSGTFLIRRDSDAFALVAANPTGHCVGEDAP